MLRVSLVMENLPMDEEESSKVFYTSYNYRSDPRIHIIIYNITFPVSIVDNLIERQRHLERANDIISTDFVNVRDIFYQVTASYTLVNRETGVTQLWTGSFFTTYLQNPSVIQGFKKYDSTTFVDSSYRLLDNAEQILRNNGENSVWLFESLRSVIFNIQAKVPHRHGIFQTRQIASHTRYRKSFNLF